MTGGVIYAWESFMPLTPGRYKFGNQKCTARYNFCVTVLVCFACVRVGTRVCFACVRVGTREGPLVTRG